MRCPNFFTTLRPFLSVNTEKSVPHHTQRVSFLLFYFKLFEVSLNSSDSIELVELI